MNLKEDNAMQDSLKKYLLKRSNAPERAEKYAYFYQLAKEKGIVPFRYARIAEEYTDDYFADTGINRADKEWFYQRGITSYKANWYGLTKDNYNEYISDFDFYSPKNYLQNSLLIKWFDYKLTTYYVLSSFKKYMPRHYFYIANGELVPLDLDIQRYGKYEDVLSILKSKPIVLKSCTGGHGKGFYKIQRTEKNKYLINENPSTETDVLNLISTLDDYLLTEYGIPHKVFRDACGKNRFAVLRTVTVFDKYDGPQLTAALMRLGTSTSGLVTDYDGCINCGVDLETGKLFHPLLRSGDEEGVIKGTPIKFHPDTGVDIETLTVPNFMQLLTMVKQISSHFSLTPYLVMDIIPTDEGFEILEINSHGQVRNLEPFFPFRKNKYNLRVFQTRDW